MPKQGKGAGYHMGSQSPVSETGFWDVQCYLTWAKKPKLVREVEKYRLDIAGLTSMLDFWEAVKLKETFGA